MHEHGMSIASRYLIVACALVGNICYHLPAEASELTLATFRVDVSPPLGDGVGIGFMKETLTIEHPLLAKGILLGDSDDVYVICALDYCGLSNGTYDRFREKIAEAAGTSASKVSLQVLHQHSAPAFDMDARKILYSDDPVELARGIDFAEDFADKIAIEVKQAAQSMTHVTHVGTAKTMVEQVASSRRLEQLDGSILSRLSSTTDPKLIEAPEGLIDPWLRTVAFYSHEQKLVELHYYATHPQSVYGDGRVTYDVPGIARERRQQETGVFQVYLTGCGGNVAFGKYNNRTLAARQQLANRLHDAMQSASKSLSRKPVTDIDFQMTTIQFPLTVGDAYSKKTNQRIMADPHASLSQRIKASMNLAWIDRVNGGHRVEASCLSVGSIRLIQLPGEVFVEYQLFAQEVDPTLFVAVAAYGDCGMWYIGPDQIYKDRGGYEQTWSFGGPVEKQLKHILQSFLTKSTESE